MRLLDQAQLVEWGHVSANTGPGHRGIWFNRHKQPADPAAPAWIHPHPAKELAALDVVREERAAPLGSPVVVAITTAD